MFRRSSPIVRLLLVPVVLFASWGCCSSMPRNHLILVGSEEAQEAVPVLSKQRRHQMVWRSLDGTTGVAVVVTLKEGQKRPFKNMSCEGTSCAVACVPSSAICSSGEINPELVPPAKGEYYEYAMSLIGAAAADPGFIIKK